MALREKHFLLSMKKMRFLEGKYVRFMGLFYCFMWPLIAIIMGVFALILPFEKPISSTQYDLFCAHFISHPIRITLS